MSILRALLASLALLVAGIAVLGAATDRFRAFTTEAARRLEVLRQPIEVPQVALETQSGAHINFADLRGRWVLVDFIYTRCPTYCLALGGEFAQLQDRLAVPIAQGKVQLLSISFDPDRDTPQQLAAYLQRSGSRDHEPGQVGRAGWLAGRPVARSGGLERLERAFGITVVADKSGGYTHNAAIHLVDPGGRLVEIFDLGDPALIGQAVLRRLE